MTWLGMIILILAVGSFGVHLARMMRGRESKRSLTDEALHDLGLLCLGGALLVTSRSVFHDFLVSGFALCLAIYLARTFLPRRKKAFRTEREG